MFIFFKFGSNLRVKIAPEFAYLYTSLQIYFLFVHSIIIITTMIHITCIRDVTAVAESVRV